MKLADEIRQKYATQHYTFEDVVNEIRKHVFETYEEVAKYKFSTWPGFSFTMFKGIPKMKWEYGREVSGCHCLRIPEGSIDFDPTKIGEWFEDQGFVFTTNENCRCYGWRIEF